VGSVSPAYDVALSAPFRIFTAILSALWLWMFLSPMEQLHLVNQATSFAMVFLGLLVAQMTPWRWLRGIAAFVVTEAYIVHYYAGPVGVLQGSGHIGHENVAQSLIDITRYEWQQGVWLLHGTEQGWADPLQTHLFLWCICCMYWLIAYASARVRLWLFYNVSAAVLLAIVDGNTAVHPNWALVVVLILCVLNLGLLQFRRLRTRVVQSGRGAPSRRYFASLLALLSISLTVAWVLPKDGPVWADPAKAIAAWHGSGPGGAAQKVIGYQENNEHLGGSFVMNHDPVLTMVSKYPAYLRGMVYSYYTGQGWQPGYNHFVPVPVGETFAEYGLDQTKVKGKPVQQKITVVGENLRTSVLFGAYAVQQVKGSGFTDGDALEVSQDTGIVSVHGMPKGLTYTVTSYEMQTPDDALQKLPPLPDEREAAFPVDIRETYLQLPAIPDRVRQLAYRLAGNKHSEYDIVTTVRDFLRYNYTYETQGIPQPAANQDYVDQFLFDSKKGYCNNFSTSMAVLLRALGIPTRWVTGFAPGEEDPSYKGPDFKYTYENADAHSWVEVYFPNYGWVPFDPTPNFDLPYLPTDSTATPTPAVGQTTTNMTVNPPKASKVDKTDTHAATTANASMDWGAWFRTVLWGLAIAAAVLLVGLWVFRRRVQVMRSQWIWRQLTDQAMLRALQHLVNLLRRMGDIPRHNSTTLRDLRQVAETYGVDGEDYRHLVQTAESYWYGRKTPSEDDLRRARQTWLRWILRVLRRDS
jgi:transglutaminase-like putative cysteine protease